MKTRPPEPIIIGRDPVATFLLVVAAHDRTMREAKAARRKERYCRFAKNCIDTLRFWK